MKANGFKKIIVLLLFTTVWLTAQQAGARYLIVTNDNFYNAIQPLAEWKNRTGMKCRVVRLSAIGSTADAIRTYVVNAYNNWPLRPEFLLLVGAPNYLPLPIVNGTYSDNYYTNMDADIYNEILSGRLTVHDTTEAKTVVNKILNYERHPATGDPSWFKKGTVIANIDYDPPDDSIYWSDVKHAAGLMVANGFTRVDTFSDQYGHSSSNVISAVNSGRSYLLYRGTGVNNWSSPFDCNPGSTTNGAKLPIVLSITCRTMGTGSTPAAAEYWLLTGTPTQPRGGAGYFATTTAISGGAHLRSAVAKGFFDAAFFDHKRTFGEACEGGRIRVYSLYPGDAHEYYGYTTLGDPEMGLWTDTPCSLIVDHPVIIPIVSASFTVSVARAAGGSPMSGAFVCVMGKADTSLYALDTTDASGIADFTVYPQTFYDTVFVTVSGQNLQPYEGFLIVSSIGPYIRYQRSWIDDSLSGHGDGVINPGEAINLPVWVRNVGASTGHGISCVIRCGDSLITITDSLKFYDDIHSLDSAFSGVDGYRFAVDPDCPDGHLLDFELLCRDENDSTWRSNFQEKVWTARLLFSSMSISGGNGNLIVEPGETVFVKVALENTGSAGLADIAAVLTTPSLQVGVIDSQGTYLRIGPDSIVRNDFDPFVIYADSAAPHGTIVPFRMSVSAGYYQDSFDFTLVVGRRNYYIWNPGLNPGPGTAIHATLHDLGYMGEIGTTLPPELEVYKALFVCAGVYPNNRIITRTNPEALAMRDFLFNHNGRIYLEGGDIWYHDPRNNNGYVFDTLFGLRATADGNPDMGPAVGQTGTFTEAMNFGYAGENNSIDHISAVEGFLIFQDGDNGYDCGVAFDASSYSYRTVGTTFQLGALTNGFPPSTIRELLKSIMGFFGFPVIGVHDDQVLTGMDKPVLFAGPSPFRRSLSILIRAAGPMTGSLKVYDLSGRVRKTIIKDINLAAGTREYVWDGTDDRNDPVTEGVYFVRFEGNNLFKTVKIIYLR